ncbi:MAG: succinylglutamate desuccinylase/aspartoacylase family protein [Sulfurimonas sp.]|uniref:M99 family carboxypeptidase catalytic domain-containing protein n=1 Tax=Sulfurimonas sp. TaxID=2022749 RepID=UPI00262BFCC9|nr:M99 family carboxypeptidase catalytic domain-containing protein [Sulfurimonas sp.]MCW8894264.1 succinylglutamate desuccinylase/aspartoacylase family protein [Sulfurimonas sp.]MCW8953995.1 succinylglutamate desuccinylase/aspartoacylase family protein [Sulfurimonas sp.]MCW9067658.1 succinylglutamate desuccinylase/aspartoacylase family protein [Sulfurimonas sp.]
MNFFSAKVLLLILFSYNYAFANVQLIKKENSDDNTTLLVIAGIHGDEPGGYFAASILATHYNITSKNLWIVPNLNQKSILKNSRGIHGDMNRKFATLKKSDKDAETIKEIKNIILTKKVSLVLNLHDGHGFYRKENHGKIFNPNAWGQTCVIDQCNLLNQDQPFGNLNSIALDVKERMNKKLLKKHHSFNVKNTKTKFDDEAMQLSLTYFAVTNNKPAFAIESSKNLSSLSQKVFYQLLAIEEFMNIMDISFTREFKLTEKNIDNIIKNYGNISINGNFSLNLTNIKKSLSFIPLRLKSNVFEFSNPLGSVVQKRGMFIAYVGNKKILTLKPQYFEMVEKCAEEFEVIIDGNKVSLNNTSDIIVNDDFNIIKKNDYRVNVIGYSSRNHQNESGLSIKLKDLNKRFSVDKSNRVYRVEFYKNNEFCFMSKVHFK